MVNAKKVKNLSQIFTNAIQRKTLFFNKFYIIKVKKKKILFITVVIKLNKEPIIPFKYKYSTGNPSELLMSFQN